MVMYLDGSEIQPVAYDQDFFDYHYGQSFGFPLISQSTNSIIFPSNRSGWINYWRTSTDGEDLNIVFSEESDQTDAQLSPDGCKLAFVSNTNGTTRLTVININDSRTPKELVVPEMGTVSALSWSPDGNKIVLAAKAGASDALHIVDIKTKRSKINRIFVWNYVNREATII